MGLYLLCLEGVCPFEGLYLLLRRRKKKEEEGRRRKKKEEEEGRSGDQRRFNVDFY